MELVPRFLLFAHHLTHVVYKQERRINLTNAARHKSHPEMTPFQMLVRKPKKKGLASKMLL
jgi:hypothetical protein